MSIGDKVRISNGCFSGMTGVIIANGQREDVYHIKLTNGKTFAFSEGNIEPMVKISDDKPIKEDKPTKKRTSKKKNN